MYSIEEKLETKLAQLASRAYLMGFSHCQGVKIDGQEFNKPNAEKIYVDETLPSIEALITEARLTEREKWVGFLKILRRNNEEYRNQVIDTWIKAESVELKKKQESL